MTLRILLPLFVVLGLVYVLVTVLKSLGRERMTADTSAPPFRKCQYLLSRAERAFFEALSRAAGGRFHIFPKVRLLDLLYMPAGTQHRQSWFNRVCQKHVDFVLCDRQFVSPLLVIELDDTSHERQDRRERDQLVDAALRSAELPVLHVRAQREYVIRDVLAMIDEKLSHVQVKPGQNEAPRWLRH